MTTAPFSSRMLTVCTVGRMAMRKSREALPSAREAVTVMSCLSVTARAFTRPREDTVAYWLSSALMLQWMAPRGEVAVSCFVLPATTSRVFSVCSFGAKTPLE